MKAMLLQFRRAPGRIIASVVAMALAVAAVGVLAIPMVSASTLHAAVERDGLADIIVDTTTIDERTVASVRRLAGVDAAEGQAIAAVRLDDGTPARLVGLDVGRSSMDRLHLTAGRLPTAPDEVVVAPFLAAIGDSILADGRVYRVVGNGDTLWWTDSVALFVMLDPAAQAAGGLNRLVILADDDDAASLRTIATEVRTTLEASGATFTTMPVLLPDGSTPIDQDIEQVSTLIGLLGVFAAGVALVLLASTTNTLIAERTREIAVMRALGGRRRSLQRRLRRVAIGLAAIALVIGLPLGIVISNVIARVVLQEFVGITPDVAVDWRVVVGSAIATLVGARLVAARAARRVVRVPLADALRDRDGDPFGQRRVHRFATRLLPVGGPGARIALRTSVRRPARTLAVVLQIAAATGAALLVPSLATSVNAFNSSTQDPWSWESVTFARDPGLPFDRSVENSSDGLEAGVWTGGEIDGWEIDVFGLPHDTELFDPLFRDPASRWIGAGQRDAIVSAGFADRTGVDLGDVVTVTLAPGTVEYVVVGLADDSARAVYVDRDVLAADLGAPGRADTIWAAPGATVPPIGVASSTTTAADLAADDEAARDAIVVIFGAIGAIVAGVAGLAVLSTMTVNLYERRHELAALQALGARRRRLRGLVLRELALPATLGLAAGLALGALATRGIIASFESANAVDIGVVDATGVVPVIVLGSALLLAIVTFGIVRTVARRPVALTLRSAA